MWTRGFNSFSEENTKNRNKNKNKNNKNSNNTTTTNTTTTNTTTTTTTTTTTNEKVENDRPNNYTNRDNRPNNYNKTDNRPNNYTNRYNRPNNRNDRYTRNRGSDKITNEDKIKQLIKEGFLPSSTEENEKDDVKQTSYLEHCKKEKEKDELKKTLLKSGWVSYIYKNGKIQCSRDGINYYDDIKNSYSEDVKIEKEQKEEEENEYELSMRFCEAIQELDRKYERESYDYYETYNELDMYAIAKLERLKYEEYEKQFLVQNEEGTISDEESETENLDD